MTEESIPSKPKIADNELPTKELDETPSVGEANSAIVEFLLAEFENVNQEFTRQRQEGMNRLNFFITLTSLIGGALIILGEVGSPSSTDLQYITLGALFFLVIIGWYTFDFTISRDDSTDMVVRAGGRIRRYFTDHRPEIKPYITWQNHDEPTPWITKNVSNVRRTAQALLTFLIAAAFGIVINLIFQLAYVSFAVGILIFGITWFLLDAYAAKRLKKATESASQDVRFIRVKEQVDTPSPEKTLENKD